MSLGKNPLRMSKKTTAMHPNHKGRVVACKECTNEKFKKETPLLACPNCGLYTIYPSTTQLDAEFYCSACDVHWGRTENW